MCKRSAFLLLLSLGLLIQPLSIQAIAVPKPLNSLEVKRRMEQLPTWKTDGQQLSCTYEFKDFVAAIAFVNQLVKPAETLQHHPDLTIRYNRVTINLSTHDAGGLTSLDFDLAKQIVQLQPSSATCV